MKLKRKCRVKYCWKFTNTSRSNIYKDGLVKWKMSEKEKRSRVKSYCNIYVAWSTLLQKQYSTAGFFPRIHSFVLPWPYMQYLQKRGTKTIYKCIYAGPNGFSLFRLREFSQSYTNLIILFWPLQNLSVFS